MACWYSMVPYIVDGLPAEQEKAARFMTQDPAALRQHAGPQLASVREAEDPGRGTPWVPAPSGWASGWTCRSAWTVTSTRPTPTNPSSCTGLLLPASSACRPRQGVKVGRQELYKMTFRGSRERPMRDLIARSMGSAGFDPGARHPGDHDQPLGARLLVRVRVRRGTSRSTQTVRLPGEVAARPFGRVTFANTDRSSRAYIDSAIDAACQAVEGTERVAASGQP